MPKTKFVSNGILLGVARNWTLGSARYDAIAHLGERVYLAPEAISAALPATERNPLTVPIYTRSGCFTVEADSVLTDDQARALPAGMYVNNMHRMIGEIESVYWHIGELAKTPRFPAAQHFTEIVGTWLLDHSKLHLQAINQYAIIVAYNRQWVNAGCLEWNGIERSNPYITR